MPEKDFINIRRQNTHLKFIHMLLIAVCKLIACNDTRPRICITPNTCFSYLLLGKVEFTK